MLHRPDRLLAHFTLVVLSCSMACTRGDGSSERSDGGASGEGDICARDDDCNDNRYCNGEEVCEPSAEEADQRGCVAISTPCVLDLQRCEEDTRRCVTRCEIDEDADADGVVANECGGTDCDDSDPFRFPGNIEVCDVDHHDEDCDSTTFGIRDQDGDDSPDAECCNADEDGTLLCGSDCDDTKAGANPRVPEVCDGFDNDCDGRIDEGVTKVAYADEDGDGYGDPTVVLEVDCANSKGSSDNGLDCDDQSAEVRPGALELCDGIDNNCDGIYERDLDGDGHLDPNAVCEGDLMPRDDCNDLSSNTYPGAQESCDGFDNDCDGETDDRRDAAGACAARSDLAGGFCVSRTCEVVRCEVGFGDCNESSFDGCETPLVDDKENCGACGIACPLGAECVGGICQTSNIVSVVVGQDHACAVSDAGGVGCWGRNGHSQLGRGNTRDSEKMVNVKGLEHVTQVSVGSEHSCALTQDGAIYCWGRGRYFPLGFADDNDRPTPALVIEGDFESISSGGVGNCALQSEGAYCWGRNVELVGRGRVPSLVPFSAGVVSVVADGFKHCAVLESGRVECAGFASAYLGLGDTTAPDLCGYSDPMEGAFLGECFASPTELAGIDNAEFISGSCVSGGGAVSCFDNDTNLPSETFPADLSGSELVELSAFDTAGACVRYASGEVYCQVPYIPQTMPASPLSLDGEVVDLDVGLRASCFVIDGRVQCRGGGAIMGLGDDEVALGTKPIAMPAEVVSLEPGSSAHCALTTGGETLCFGAGNTGVEQNVAFSQAIAIESGSNFSCALFGDGTVGCEGNNDHGQLGSEDGEAFRLVEVPPAREITAYGQSACAISREGEVFCWGRSRDGSFGKGAPENASGIPPTRVEGLSDILSAQLGQGFACALDRFGAVACWGQGTAGQLGDGRSQSSRTPVPIDLFDDIVEIGVGGEFACALRLGGSVHCWGKSDAGQLGYGDLITGSLTPLQIADLQNIHHLTVGAAHACASDLVGTVYCWGANALGQVGSGDIPEDLYAFSPLSKLKDPLRIPQDTDLVVKKIKARNTATCAVSKAGDALCWGTDIQGRATDEELEDESCLEVDLSSGVIGFVAEICPEPTLVSGL